MIYLLRSMRPNTAEVADWKANKNFKNKNTSAGPTPAGSAFPSPQIYRNEFLNIVLYFWSEKYRMSIKETDKSALMKNWTSCI